MGLVSEDRIWAFLGKGLVEVTVKDCPYFLLPAQAVGQSSGF